MKHTTRVEFFIDTSLLDLIDLISRLADRLEPTEIAASDVGDLRRIADRLERKRLVTS